MARPRETYWYALKVFYNRAASIQEELREARYETYRPVIVVEKFEQGELEYLETPVVASLLFVKCPERYLIQFKQKHERHLLYYRDLATGRPGRIDDREMELFRAATSIVNPEAMYLGSDTARWCTGDRFRVTEGVYKGQEGYVRRVRHARKLLVCIRGIAVVAVTNIHPQFLEKI